MAKPEVGVKFMGNVVVKPEMSDCKATNGIAGHRGWGAVLIGHGEGDHEAWGDRRTHSTAGRGA